MRPDIGREHLPDDKRVTGAVRFPEVRLDGPTELTNAEAASGALPVFKERGCAIGARACPKLYRKSSASSRVQARGCECPYAIIDTVKAKRAANFPLRVICSAFR